MKKIIFVILICCTAYSCFAQKLETVARKKTIRSIWLLDNLGYG